jgi:hypothetical protein
MGANMPITVFCERVMSALNERSPTYGTRTIDCPRENFGGPWRNLDIICNFHVYYTVHYILIRPRVHKLISNKQQQISH